MQSDAKVQLGKKGNLWKYMWLSVETIKMSTDSKPISIFAEKHMKKPLCIIAKHIKNTKNQLSL